MNFNNFLYIFSFFFGVRTKRVTEGKHFFLRNYSGLSWHLRERRYLLMTKRGPVEYVFSLKHYLACFAVFLFGLCSSLTILSSFIINVIKDDLVEVYDRVPELVSHVHLPVQSGSDRILKLMRRRYNVEKYLNLVDKIRVVRPDMSFSSDFIVGFPGETNEDFQDTMNIINEVRYDESFSFIYSPRPNTTASDMEDDVTNEEKKERLKILQTRLSQLSFGFSRKKVGTNQDCLIYGQSKRDPGQLQGRTICNRVVNFQSNDTDLVGQIVNIQINEALPNCLRGNLQN